MDIGLGPQTIHISASPALFRRRPPSANIRVMAIRIGISGWTYPPWRGVFYPKGLAHRRELEYASRRLSSIEINGTFYSLQRPESYERWRDETPEGFVFSVKGPPQGADEEVHGTPAMTLGEHDEPYARARGPRQNGVRIGGGSEPLLQVGAARPAVRGYFIGSHGCGDRGLGGDEQRAPAPSEGRHAGQYRSHFGFRQHTHTAGGLGHRGPASQ